MTSQTAPTYDEFPYDGYAYWFTHPDHLWVMGTARGLEPAPPDQARILELGCGDGGNLLSLATLLPSAELVGLDLSQIHIERAQAAADHCGITNVRLLQADLSDTPDDLGTFDYIIAHGVYSWIPLPVRDRLMEVIARHLAPDGVALVSYNAFPGQHDLEPVRELMRLHVGPVADPMAKVRQARNIARLWTSHMKQRDAEHRGAVAGRIETLVEQSSDQILRHDWLSENESPLLFSDFCDHAARFGLAWLDNALPASQRIENCDDEARAMLEALPRGVRQQQYLDCFENTRFRVSLLGHATRVAEVDARDGAQVFPEVSGFRLDAMADLFVESRLEVDVWSPESRFRPAVLLETPSGFIEVSGPPLRIALSTLYHHRPHAIALSDLFEEVVSQLSHENQDGGLADTDEGRAQLFGLLLTELVRFWTRELIHFWRAPPALASPRRIPQRPVSPPLQRYLATRSRYLPNLAHRHCELDPERLQIIAALDGTADLEALKARFGPNTERYLEALAAQGLVSPS